MKYVEMEGIRASRLCLGCGKMTDMAFEKGHMLIGKSLSLGINIFDAHHRYGNAETILGGYINPIYNINYMSKLSAYCELPNAVENLENSLSRIGNIDIYWVSDLDNEKLYMQGEKFYESLKRQQFGFDLGITTENPKLAIQFIHDHPECKFLMIPIYPGNDDMVTVCQMVKHEGIHVFAIKPFDDGRVLKNNTIKECLEFQKMADPAVTVFGTSNVKHLEEVVETWEAIS